MWESDKKALVSPTVLAGAVSVAVALASAYCYPEAASECWVLAGCFTDGTPTKPSHDDVHSEYYT